MGFGLPSAVGAAIGCPDKTIISISGDGGFQMNIQELATAVNQELPMIVIIFNNNYLGMVRQMQELFYNKRYSITCLRYRKSCKGKCGTPGYQCPEYTPNFVKVAEAYGMHGIFVKDDSEIEQALIDADRISKERRQPVIIEIGIGPYELVLPMIRGGSSFDDIIL